MRIVAPKRRSSFGTDCVQCGDELIAPDRSEYRDGLQILLSLALFEMRRFV